MIKSIAVGLESVDSFDAITGVAANLAIGSNASLHAIYVEDVDLVKGTEIPVVPFFPMEGYIPMLPDRRAELEESFIRNETQLNSRFLKFISDTRIKGRFQILRENVNRALVDQSRTHDLLIIGKTGKADADPERVLGYHVESILRHAFSPVLLVPEKPSFGFKTLVAYDGTPGSHRALAAACEVAKSGGADVRVVAVAEPEKGAAILEGAAEYLSNHEMSLDLSARSGDSVAEILQQEAKEFEADILAMGAFGHGRIAEFFGSGETHSILGAVPCTVLICGPESI